MIRDLVHGVEQCPACGTNVAAGYLSRHARVHDQAVLERRFWSKVDRRGPDECWPWLASRDSSGYGQFNPTPTRPVRAFKVAYQLLVGEVPPGLELDHRCRNIECVNPAHLEPVTHRENLLRGDSPSARYARRTHCPKGHPFSGDNLRVDPHGHRRCYACSSARDHANYVRRKAAA